MRGACNGRHAAFQRLTQGLKGCLAKFRQFVQKQHPPVGKTHLAWARIAPAAHQRHIGYGVVRRAKGPHPHKPGLGRQLAGNAVNLGDFQRFFKVQRRQNGGQALG